MKSTNALKVACSKLSLRHKLCWTTHISGTIHCTHITATSLSFIKLHLPYKKNMFINISWIQVEINTITRCTQPIMLLCFQAWMHCQQISDCSITALAKTAWQVRSLLTKSCWSKQRQGDTFVLAIMAWPQAQEHASIESDSWREKCWFPWGLENFADIESVCGTDRKVLWAQQF